MLVGWITHLLHMRAKRREERERQDGSEGGREEAGSVVSSGSREQEVMKSPKKNVAE